MNKSISLPENYFFVCYTISTTTVFPAVVCQAHRKEISFLSGIKTRLPVKHRFDLPTRSTIATRVSLTSNSNLTLPASIKGIQGLTVFYSHPLYSGSYTFSSKKSNHLQLQLHTKTREKYEIRKKVYKVAEVDKKVISEEAPHNTITAAQSGKFEHNKMKDPAANSVNASLASGINDTAFLLSGDYLVLARWNYNFSPAPVNNDHSGYNIFFRKRSTIAETIAAIDLYALGLIHHISISNCRYPFETACRLSWYLVFSQGKISRCGEVIATESENKQFIQDGPPFAFSDNLPGYSFKMGERDWKKIADKTGIVLERLDLEFSSKKNKILAKAHTVVIGKKTRE